MYTVESALFWVLPGVLNTIIIMKINTPWTSAEVENLQSIYSTKSAPELMTIFGRSFAAIDQKARSMGLFRSTARSSRAWDAAEVKLLHDIYPSMGASAVSSIIGRAQTAVLKKAQKIGIQMGNRVSLTRRRWTEEEADFLKSSIGIMTLEDIAKKLDRSLHSIDNRISDNGTKNPNAKCIRHLPIGTERISRGKIFRKVALTGVRRIDWKRVEVIEWEAINGPVPEGMVLIGRRKGEPLRLMSPSDVPMMAARSRMSPTLIKLLSIKSQIGAALNLIESMHPEDQNETGAQRKYFSRTNSWSAQGDDFLLNNYLQCTNREMAGALGRSSIGIERRLKILGLTRPSCTWSQENEKKLSDLYPTTSITDLACIFGRSKPAIYQRAKRLGVKKERANV
ncbi:MULTISPECIES: hypothetical protein [Delftia]|uniref:Uncharacterized protein n=1 Tax=Delftia deserti TaxID=1651218 RepID=A0ABW5EJ63_9BURK